MGPHPWNGSSPPLCPLVPIRQRSHYRVRPALLAFPGASDFHVNLFTRMRWETSSQSPGTLRRPRPPVPTEAGRQARCCEGPPAAQAARRAEARGCQARGHAAPGKGAQEGDKGAQGPGPPGGSRTRPSGSEYRRTSVSGFSVEGETANEGS